MNGKLRFSVTFFYPNLELQPNLNANFFTFTTLIHVAFEYIQNIGRHVTEVFATFVRFSKKILANLAMGNIR